MAAIAIRNAVKRYGKKTAVSGVTFAVEPGEFFALLGPSGCGKTTLLRAVAGLESIEGGEIAFGERVMSRPGQTIDPFERKIGFVFQDLALWPHMSALEHLLFVLGKGEGRERNRERSMKVLAELRIDHLAKKRPHEISGGERQRLALARALVTEPSILLCDEPLSSIDPSVASEIRALLRELNRARGMTVLYVTHLQSEAFEMASRIAVMQDGEIRQIADPVTLYEKPASAFVAGFVGQCTLCPGPSSVDGKDILTAFGAVAVPEGLIGRKNLAAVFREDNLTVVKDGGSDAIVVDVQYRGGSFTTFARLQTTVVRIADKERRRIGDSVKVAFVGRPWVVRLDDGAKP